MPTIRDVARQAAVSPATVSMALKGSVTVADKTRSRVQEAARHLGYKPGRGVGRPTKQAQSRTFDIALVYSGSTVYLRDQRAPNLTRLWFEVVRSEFSQRGHSVHFFGGYARFEDDPLFAQVAQAGQIDGVLLIGGAAEAGYLDWVAKQKIPALAINRQPRCGEFGYVTVDHQGGGRQVAELLLRQGHRRVAMVRRDRAYPYGEQRQAGLMAGLAEQNLEPVLVHRLALDTSETAHEEACRAILKANATAVFFETDALGVMGVNTLQKMGVDVPGAVSAVGFDDTGDICGAGLRLTSVSFSRDLVGQYAADLLVEMIERQDRVLNSGVTLRTTIAEYDTVAPRPGLTVE